MNLNREVAVGDQQRIELVMNAIANYIDPTQLIDMSTAKGEPRLSRLHSAIV